MSEQETENIDTSEEIENYVNNYRCSVSAPRGVLDILSIDAEDESLRKYKESLLGSAIHGDLGDTSDPRKLIVTEFAVVFSPEENRPNIIHNLDTDAGNEYNLTLESKSNKSLQGISKLNLEGIKIKEGAKYKFRITFRVQHEIVAGIRFLQKVTKTLMSEEDSLMIGSYPPSSQLNVFEFPKFDYNTAPTGMMYRGKYQTRIKLVDSDGEVYLELPYNLEIAKSW